MTVLHRSIPACLLLFAILLAGIAGADTVYLKNGGRIIGKVIKDNGSMVTINIDGGTVVQNKADIVRIKTEAETLQPKESEVLKTAEEESATPMLDTKKTKKGLFGMVEGVVDTAFSILKFDFIKKSK
ncbi:MAG: hypothetical protein NTZ95_06740 [Candidatus Omnitrophica bacterium]|nr:hypothetical protein [Candidatus Omnitrophota bacterium]